MRHDLPELRDTVAELRELCDRYGFAYYREWGLILDGWSRADESGIDLARRGIGNLKSAGLAWPRMPYWLSLLADLLARNGRPGAAERPSTPPSPTGRHTGRPVVAARGDADARRPRRRGGGRLAAALRGARWRPRTAASALLRRCERDLARRGVRSPSPAFPRRADASAPARTLRERRWS